MSPVGTGGFFAGAIVSKLTLDKSGWNQSVKSVGEDERKIKGMTAKMTANFKKVGAGMTVAGAAIVGSFGKMISSFVKTGDEIDKMSKRTGFSATALSELAHAADITGADLGSLEKGIKKMSKSIVDGEAGMTTYLRAFKNMNLETKDLIDLSPEEQFLAIGEALAKMPNPTERTAAAMDIFGRAGTQLIPLFQEGAEGLKDLREEAHDLGIVFDQEAAASAAKLKDEQTRLKGAMQGLGIQLAQVIVPALTSLATKITGVITKIKDWMKEHPGLTSLITKLVAGVGGLMAILGPMVMIFPKIVSGFKLIKIAIMALSGPIGLVVAGLSALTLGFLKVKAAKDKAKKSAENYALANRTLMSKLRDISKEAGLTAKEFSELTIKYKGNASALGTAMRKGEEGIKIQKAMADHAEENKKAQEDLSNAISTKLTPAIVDNKKAIEAQKKAAEEARKEHEEWVQFMSDLGVKYIPDANAAIEDLIQKKIRLRAELDAGNISLWDYQQGIIRINNEIKELSSTMTTTAVPAARNFGAEVLNVANTMPEMETRFFTPMQEETKKVGSVWTEVSQRIKDQWTTKLSEMLSGATSLKQGLGSIWGTIKDQFFTLISQMITKWTLGLVGKIAGGGGGLLDAFKGLFGNIGNAATGNAAGTGGGGFLGNLGGSFLGTLGKIAGPLGIGLLVSKFVDLKAVGKSVTDALVSAFGALGDIVGGIGKAIGGILTGIGKLFGGGGGGKIATGLNEHLYRIHDRLQEIKDFLFIDIRTYVIQTWTVLFNKIHDNIIHEFDELHQLGINRNNLLKQILAKIGTVAANSDEDKKEKKKLKKKGAKDKPGFIPGFDIPIIPGADALALDKPGTGGEDIFGAGGGGGGGTSPDIPIPPTPDLPDVPSGKLVRKKVFILRIGEMSINVKTDGISDNPRKFAKDVLTAVNDLLETKGRELVRLQQSVLGG